MLLSLVSAASQLQYPSDAVQVSAASVFGQMGSSGVSPYCASKAAVIGLSRTAAKENQHIRVNCVAPGKN